MANKNRYKFHFGEKNLTLTTDKDNLFMEEVERVAHEKYKIIKEQMKNADNETIAILMAINSLSTQLEREIQVEDMEKELETLRAKQLEQLKVKATATSDDDEDDA
ncbi:MAG: cell division protein ZapA [Streptococcus salivarius]